MAITSEPLRDLSLLFQDLPEEEPLGMLLNAPVPLTVPLGGTGDTDLSPAGRALVSNGTDPILVNLLLRLTDGSATFRPDSDGNVLVIDNAAGTTLATYNSTTGLFNVVNGQQIAVGTYGVSGVNLFSAANEGAVNVYTTAGGGASLGASASGSSIGIQNDANDAGWATSQPAAGAGQTVYRQHAFSWRDAANGERWTVSADGDHVIKNASGDNVVTIESDTGQAVFGDTLGLYVGIDPDPGGPLVFLKGVPLAVQAATVSVKHTSGATLAQSDPTTIDNLKTYFLGGFATNRQELLEGFLQFSGPGPFTGVSVTGGWYYVVADAAFAVRGFAPAAVALAGCGADVWIYNPSAFAMTLANENVGEATAAYRIHTRTGGDVVVASEGIAHLIYSPNISRWVLMS